MIDVKGLDKGSLLAALWNRAIPFPLSIPITSRPMTSAEARAILGHDTDGDGAHLGYVSIFRHRELGIDIWGDAIDEEDYDLTNGSGACQAAVDDVRSGRQDAIERHPKPDPKPKAAKPPKRVSWDQ